MKAWILGRSVDSCLSRSIWLSQLNSGSPNHLILDFQVRRAPCLSWIGPGHKNGFDNLDSFIRWNESIGSTIDIAPIFIEEMIDKWGGGIERMRRDNAIYAMPKPLWSNLNSEIIFYGPTMVQFNWDSRIDGLRQQWRWWVLFWWWRLPGSVPSIQDHLNFQSNLLPLFR